MRARLSIWALIGGLLAFSFGDRWYWLAFVAGFWLLGAVCLRRITQVHLGELKQAVRTSRSARAGLLLGAALLAVGGWLFGAIAALLGFTIVVSLALLSGLRRDPAEALELVTGLSLAGATVLIAGFAGEWIVSRPALGAEWGSPGAKAAQYERYDSLAQRWGGRSLAQHSNLFGFRSPHEQVAKDSGVFRVFALGDSFTWGTRVLKTEDTWPAELERILKEAYPDTRIEVVNAAKVGYTTANEAELMRRLGWQFDPDILVVQFYLNDIFPSGPKFRRLEEPEMFPRRHRVLPHRFRWSGAARRSVLLAYLEDKLERVVGDHDLQPLYEDGTVGWRQLNGALEEMGSEAAARGVPALLLILPKFPSGAFTAESHPSRPMHAKVRRAARQAGFEVLDLTPVFADSAATGRQWWVTPYDPHPGESAQRLIARETFRFLRAHGQTP